MQRRANYFFPLFIAILQLYGGKNVDAIKNKANLTVLVALNHVIESQSCVQDILQKTLNISKERNDGVEGLVITVKDQADRQKRVLDALKDNLQQAISAAVKKQLDEQTETIAEMKRELQHTFYSSVTNITDEIKNSRNTDAKSKSEMERLAGENEKLERNIADKEKQVHDLSRKLDVSQLRIQDLEDNMKRMIFKVGKRPEPNTGMNVLFGNQTKQLETFEVAVSEQKLQTDAEYTQFVGPDNQLQLTVKILMEVNADRIAEMENKDKQVQNLSLKLEDSLRKVEELQANIEQLTLKVESQNKTLEATQECVQQQSIKELMAEFKTAEDWPVIGRGLKQILYNNSEAYAQLEEIDFTKNPLLQIGMLGFTELASVLLSAGLPVDAETNSLGYTLLEVASACNHLPLVKLVVLHGADINIQRSPRGMTPLMWAAEGGHLDVVKWLVRAGADVTAVSKAGNTAFDKAKLSGEQEVVKFFESLRRCMGG